MDTDHRHSPKGHDQLTHGSLGQARERSHQLSQDGSAEHHISKCDRLAEQHTALPGKSRPHQAATALARHDLLRGRDLRVVVGARTAYIRLVAESTVANICVRRLGQVYIDAARPADHSEACECNGGRRVQKLRL